MHTLSTVYSLSTTEIIIQDHTTFLDSLNFVWKHEALTELRHCWLSNPILFLGRLAERPKLKWRFSLFLCYKTDRSISKPAADEPQLFWLRKEHFKTVHQWGSRTLNCPSAFREYHICILLKILQSENQRGIDYNMWTGTGCRTKVSEAAALSSFKHRKSGSCFVKSVQLAQWQETCFITT